MTLRDDVEAAKRHVGPICGVRRTIETLDGPFRDELAEAIADVTLQPTALSLVLRDKHQIELSEYTIRRHRDRRCRCH